MGSDDSEIVLTILVVFSIVVFGCLIHAEPVEYETYYTKEIVTKKYEEIGIDVVMWLLLDIPLPKTNYYLRTNVTTHEVDFGDYTNTKVGDMITIPHKVRVE